ncbi:MAG: Error-prone repair protein ImuA [Bacteroidota bacterium]
MPPTKADIIARLQKDILLQYAKPAKGGNTIDIELGELNYAFPNQRFPLAAVHEFCSSGAEEATATTGFVSGILSMLMQTGGATLWIGPSRTLFPPALKSFGIDPDKIIFIDLVKEKDILWAMEEALKCSGLAAVIGEMRELDFTASRRLQLAVEQSRVTGFILRQDPRKISTTACVTRWKISCAFSELMNDMPGIGFPRWNVSLLKVRNGKPGAWQIEWSDGKFNHIVPAVAVHVEEQKKAG